MKYFLDTEFIEKPNTITLISIGIVCEDGRELYRISNEYNYEDADEWVQKNVIVPMYIQAVHGDNRNIYSAESFHQYWGRPIRQIKNDVLDFIGNDDNVEFYGYYADYDWVIFCWIFGRMIELPKGWPMYCRDLKQILDAKAEECLITNMTNEWGKHPIIKGEIVNKGIPAFKTVKEVIERIKQNPKYPKQENEHNALADAKWNYELYKFLTAA